MIIPVRMTPGEREACVLAASKAKLTLSAWIRSQLEKTAKIKK